MHNHSTVHASGGGFQPNWIFKTVAAKNINFARNFFTAQNAGNGQIVIFQWGTIQTSANTERTLEDFYGSSVPIDDGTRSIGKHQTFGQKIEDFLA